MRLAFNMRKERIVHLHSPIKDEDILDLKIGDIVYINGNYLLQEMLVI